jgi:hypothetical protein
MAVGRPQTYPWDEWADGREHEISRGTHFRVPVETMRVNLHKFAASHGTRVATRRRQDSLKFTFSEAAT